MKKAGLSLEDIINNAVIEFYKEATKTVVKVDHEELSRIRKEAMKTQEKLIVPEQEEPLFTPVTPLPEHKDVSTVMQTIDELTPLSDSWQGLKNALSEIEKKALYILIRGESDIKKYADECGIMLEVLIDGLNEKAMDFVGDNLVDGDIVIYDDYKKQIKEMVE